MKSLARIIFAAAVSATLYFTTSHVSAQQQIASWDTAMNGPGGPALPGGGGIPPAPFTNNTAALNVIITPLMKGAGISNITTTAVYGGSNWVNSTESAAIASSNYITYAVQAAPGYTVSFSTNEAYVHNSGTGPVDGELQYSTDGINYTNLLPITYNGSVVITNNLSTFSILQNVPSTTTNFFRLINWGATGEPGTWYFYNPTIPAGTLLGTTNEFVICGAVIPLPPGQNLATWDTAMNGPGGPALPGGGGTPPAPFTNNTAALNVIVTPLMKGAGISNITTTAVYGGSNWVNSTEAAAIASSNYVTYAIQVATNYTVSFYTNEAFVHNSGTGPVDGELQYSTDGINYTNLLPITYNGSVVITNNLSTFNFLQNVPSTTTNFFRIVNWGATGEPGTWYFYNPTIPAGTLLGTTNEFVIAGGVASLLSSLPPTNITISPSSQSVIAGQSAGISVNTTGTQPDYYSWYFISNYDMPSATTNLMVGQTNAGITLTNVLGVNSGGYYAIITNIYGLGTSAVATVAILDDPLIQVSPVCTWGLLDGVAQFQVTAFGSTPLTYNWYFADLSGDILAPVSNGNALGDQAVVYGAGTSTLTVSNLSYADLTNFIVVVTNVYGSFTSSVASIIGVTNNYVLYQSADQYFGITPVAFWDFNGVAFTDTTTNQNCVINPVPYLGVGTAQAVGACLNPANPTPFSGSADPNNATGDGIIYPATFPNGGDHQTNYSWGTDNYPLYGSNKLNGVQFNTSTVGAKNIFLTYQTRATTTSSEYERVQYTTDGVTWIDYPSSSTFNGIEGLYETYNNDFSGFPGVANNPNFGVRIVTECQGTATYGMAGTATNYLGTVNSYLSGASTTASQGTVTYDYVGIFGDSITNGNIPPVISPLTNTVTLQVITNTTFETTLDNVNVTNTFVVKGDTNPTNFSYSAQSLNPLSSPPFNPTFNFSTNANGVVTMVITPNTVQGNANAVAGPILVTVTDTNGDVARAWFDLTEISANPSPTNGLVGLSTNTVVNTTLAVPFATGSASNNITQLTYSTNSDNNTVVPATNILVSGIGTYNTKLLVTPASNQLGVAVLTVTVNDNNLLDPKNTPATIPFMVRPDTNVVTLDFFNYDNPNDSQTLALDQVSGGYWVHLSGVEHQMQVTTSPSGGTVLVDAINNTENLQTPLVGAPYMTNGQPTTLYYSMVISLQSANDLPGQQGGYFAAFNDGSLQTSNVNDVLLLVTNQAAPGNYRVAIGNDNSNIVSDASVAIFPQDLVLFSNYVVVTALNLATGASTVWVNPTNSSSLSATATIDSASPPGTPNQNWYGTVPHNISDFELRESGSEYSGQTPGAVTVGFVEVGTTFNSVLQTPQIPIAATYQVPFGTQWSIGITNLAKAAAWFDPDNLTLSLTNLASTSYQGVGLSTDGTNIYYGGPLTTNDNFTYSVADTYLVSAPATVYLTPVLQFNGSLLYNGSGNPVISGTSPIGAVGYTYGVEYATNLLGTWFNAGTTTVTGTGSWTFTDLNHTNPPVIFYRLYYPDDPSNPPQP